MKSLFEIVLSLLSNTQSVATPGTVQPQLSISEREARISELQKNGHIIFLP
ncbi:MAG: hypothetical protein ABI612_26440 [Betaproteobacteria bacterium]